MTKETVAKSLVLAGLVALTSSSAQASHTGIPTNQTEVQTNRTGIYVGAAVGTAALTGKNHLLASRFDAGPGNLLQNSYTPRISNTNITGDFFMGYGKRLNCFWLAIEAIGSLTSLPSKTTLDINGLNSGQFLSTKATNAWGGSLNLGYYIHQTIKLYVKLGVESRRFQVTFLGFPNETDDPFVNLNKSYRSTAFVPGLAMEVDLTSRFSLRTEYRIALHRPKTVQVSQSQTDYTTVKTTPTIHSFNLGLILKI